MEAVPAASRRCPAAATSTTCRCPRSSPSRRASTCRATPRCRDGCAPSASRSTASNPERPASQLEMVKLVLPPDSGKAGAGARHAAPRPPRRSSPSWPSWGCCDERPGLRRGAGRRARPAGGQLRAARSAMRSLVISISGDYAPAAWGQTLADQVVARAPSGCGRRRHRARQRGAGPRRRDPRPADVGQHASRSRPARRRR